MQSGDGNQQLQRSKSNSSSSNNKNIDGKKVNLVVFSAEPHHVVEAIESSVAANGDVTTKSVTVTSLITDDAHKFWDFGESRGGTPALRIHTPYGPKYLTFFYSQVLGPSPASWLKTYYFGAYLFDAEPPFAISHSTPHPIIPQCLASR